MKAFIFVNDNASAYNRYVRGEIPAQFLYGITQLEKMGFEVKVSKGKIFQDLFSFLLFKPDLFFMPFIKRKTLLFFIMSRFFGFKTKFAGWLHLNIFAPPAGTLKKSIHRSLLFVLKWYVNKIDSVFFLSEKTMAEMIESNLMDSGRCHFIPWGGDDSFYSSYQSIHSDGEIISTGRENRDLLTVLSAVSNTNINLDIYTSDNSLPDFYSNKNGDLKINKGYWPYSELLYKVSQSRGMIIPLKTNKINYCVGLSSLIEAIALGRPVIATYNPYWFVDIEKEGIGIFIRENTPDEWMAALELLSNNPELVQTMSSNARAFFDSKGKFSFTENEINTHVTRVLMSD